ncbi:MAG: putative 60S ribosomal protein L22 [Piptocephalis tieghemiana]|nr:MAG: putative 60S ribosomal protein L22 [Piptocephalis tieghemiana]
MAPAVKKVPTKVVLDLSIPANDGILDAAAFEKFLHDRIKIEGRTQNLGDNVSITRSSEIITIDAKDRVFPKRYIKYLTKKYLKKNSLRDWVRVSSSDKNTYTLRYFNIAADEEEEEEDEDEE